MTVKYIDQLPIDEKRVLIRVDYNVPYDSELNITDDTRIKATVETIDYCLSKNAKIILISHLGRPKGQRNPKMTLKPVAQRLEETLNRKIQFVDIDPGEKTVAMTKEMNGGDILLLENIRFNAGEEKNDPALGKLLAQHCDVYINDAFATSHRAHASNSAVTENVEEKGAGFLLKKEIEYGKKTLEAPQRPFGAIIGGAKVSSKLDALYNIIEKVDFIIIGGGMAFTFLKAQGYNVGESLLEETLVEEATSILEKGKSKNVEILLPVDIVCAETFDNDAASKICPANAIEDQLMGLDIGPKSIELFKSKIKDAKTIIWNGPMGAFEMPNFAEGTNEMAHALAKSDCLSIVGGGDSVTAINQAGVEDDISYISTGGGAFLELLEGKELPGISALEA